VADKPAIAAAVEKPPVRRVEGAPAPELVKEHRCIHDEPSHQAGIAADLKRNAHVVQRRTAAEERAFRAQAPQPIRIVLSTEDLTTTSQYCTATNDVRPTFSNGATTTCAAADVLTTAKRNLLVNTILPEALTRLAARISVNRLTSNLVVGSSCGDHTIPSAHSSTGVANADYVLYVSAGPIGGSTLAWAGSCQTESGTGRPIVGRANFDPEHLEYATASELEGLLDTAVHEILHALGISGGFFGANGRSSTTTKRGKPVTELDSTMAALLAEARSFTGCSTLTGVELEDEGSSGSAGSHFERRLYKDEIMTAAGGSKLSSFSLLALQDLGVGYTVNTAAAEPMVWGKATGCGFHTEKCNTAAGGAGTYFCFEASSSVQGCSFDKTSIGYCTVGTVSNLPSYFQYYSGEPTKGGTSSFMDACPYYQGYSNRNCTDADYDASTNLYLAGNTFAADSRCHMATNLLRSRYSPASSGPRCLQTRCTSGGLVEFKVNGSAYVTCPSDGATAGSIPGYDGTVTCPKASDMCATFSSTTMTTTAAAASASTTGAAAAPTTMLAGTTAAGNSTSNTTTTAVPVTTVIVTTINPIVTSMTPTTTTAAASADATSAAASTTTAATSAPTTTTITTASPLTPAPTPQASQRVIDGYIRIRGSVFAVFLASSARTAQLRSALQVDLAALLDVAAQGVIVVDLSLGSLRVNFTVTSAALSLARPSSSGEPVSAADLSARIATMASSADASWLQSTSDVYATESSETLSVAEASASTPADSSTTESPASISSAAAPPVAAVLGALCLLVLPLL
jgi:leishmanolysin